MKKRLFIFALILFIFSSTKVYAASANISASTTNAYVGDNVTINVNVYAGTWNLIVNGSGISDKIIGFDMDSNVTTNKSYSLNTSVPGTYTVTLNGDITDYDTDVTTYPNNSVIVTISERPAPILNNNQSGNQTATNNNHKDNSKVEEKKEEEKVEEKVEEKKLNITKFEIVGYDLEFDQDKYSYDLDLAYNVSDLYIIVEGEDISVTGCGKVDISSANEIEVHVKFNDKEYNYIIHLNKSSSFGSLENDAVYVSSSNKEKLFLATTLVVSCINIGIVSSILLRAKKRKKYKLDR